MSFTDIIFYPFLLIVFFAVLIIESPFGRKTLKNKFQAAKKLYCLLQVIFFTDIGITDSAFCFCFFQPPFSFVQNGLTKVKYIRLSV